MACVRIFRLLVSPSSRKNATFLVLQAFLKKIQAFARYLRVFCRAFLSQKKCFSGFCDICAPLRFQNSRYPAVNGRPTNSQMTASRPKPLEYAFLVKSCVCTKKLRNLGEHNDYKTCLRLAALGLLF